MRTLMISRTVLQCPLVFHVAPLGLATSQPGWDKPIGFYLIHPLRYSYIWTLKLIHPSDKSNYFHSYNSHIIKPTWTLLKNPWVLIWYIYQWHLLWFIHKRQSYFFSLTWNLLKDPSEVPLFVPFSFSIFILFKTLIWTLSGLSLMLYLQKRKGGSVSRVMTDPCIGVSKEQELLSCFIVSIILVNEKWPSVTLVVLHITVWIYWRCWGPSIYCMTTYCMLTTSLW